MFGLDFMPPIGSTLVVVFPIFFSYAVVKHHLMDIKLVARTSSVYLVSIATIMAIAVVIKFSLYALTPGWSTAADLFALILAVSAYNPVREYYYYLANKYFFTSLYDTQALISNISDKLSSTLDADKIYNLIYKTLDDAMHLESFGVISLDKRGTKYAVEFNKGFPIGQRKFFSNNKTLYDDFSKEGKVIIIEEIRDAYVSKGREFKELFNLLEKLKVEVLVPLSVKNKLNGLFVLGPKETGDVYNDEDLRVLEIISAQAAIAIENARLYSETREFNITLKKEVGKATSELKFANEELTGINEKLTRAYEKLHKLDRAKSEFLSIASHQLRTPLTSIKGFTSLLLEGTYGNVSKNVRATLEKVYISNERLIKLVEDLLNISRIESGKIAFEFNKEDIESLAKEVVDSMKIAAKNKKLKLAYQPPKTKVRPFNFDKSKLREVISNLVDNAIKYTRRGSVSVRLEHSREVARIIVADTGMGISKGELEYIFDKFQRGKDVNHVHTEGVGLGLYVCKKIIEAHEGKFWAESDGLMKGSRFIVELKKNFKGPAGPAGGEKSGGEGELNHVRNLLTRSVRAKKG